VWRRIGEREHAERDLEQAGDHPQPPARDELAGGERLDDRQVPTTFSHAPRKIATASRPGLGQAMIAMPAAIDSSPLKMRARSPRHRPEAAS
jgi:hypothetical protein